MCFGGDFIVFFFFFLLCWAKQSHRYLHVSQRSSCCSRRFLQLVSSHCIKPPSVGFLFVYLLFSVAWNSPPLRTRLACRRSYRSQQWKSRIIRRTSLFSAFCLCEHKMSPRGKIQRNPQWFTGNQANSSLYQRHSGKVVSKEIGDNAVKRGHICEGCHYNRIQTHCSRCGASATRRKHNAHQKA